MTFYISVVLLSNTFVEWDSICFALHGQVVNRYIDQGVAELVPGVLFVDEVQVLLFLQLLDHFIPFNRTSMSTFVVPHGVLVPACIL